MTKLKQDSRVFRKEISAPAPEVEEKVDAKKDAPKAAPKRKTSRSKG